MPEKKPITNTAGKPRTMEAKPAEKKPEAAKPKPSTTVPKR